VFASGFSESAGSVEQKARAVVTNSDAVEGSSTFDSDREDSDGEDESEDTHEEYRKDEPNAATAVVDIRGAEFKTYRAMLFYLETGCVAFAPLRSTYPDDIDIESDGRDYTPETWNEYVVRKRTTMSVIPQHPPFESSPKSLYRLTHMVELDGLQKLCQDQIKASLTPKNILKEASSKFTSLYDDVKLFEYAYLKENWPNVRKGTTATKEFLQSFSGAECAEDFCALLSQLMSS